MGRLDPRALGVYVVTSSGLVPGRGHRDVAVAAIAGGATAVQLRAKELADEELTPLAEELAARCRAAGVLFVVNDRVDVAIRSGADAVHLGQADELARVRGRIGPDLILGISVDDADQAARAEAADADYVGATVWATPTKSDARPRELEGVKEIADATSLPVVGIGGIGAANAAQVLAAGAAGVAVVSAVGAAEDPVSATRLLAEVVSRWRAGER
ncbi:MAG TPA: thiamine phosphate synthase [Actinomycetota bacterium]|nr:thiamine phosphate synthase [Actinomycetota bacterium]